MEVKHEKHETNGVFYIEENGLRIAHLDYVFADKGKFSIEHIIVNSGNEGKGLAKKLVEAAVEFARQNAFKIVPVCVYAKKVLEGSDVYKDVLFQSDTK